MRWSDYPGLSRWAPKTVTDTLEGERQREITHTHTHTHTESDVEMEQTERAVMQPQVKECQPPLMLEEARSGFSLISVQ